MYKVNCFFIYCFVFSSLFLCGFEAQDYRVRKKDFDEWIDGRGKRSEKRRINCDESLADMKLQIKEIHDIVSNVFNNAEKLSATNKESELLKLNEQIRALQEENANVKAENIRLKSSAKHNQDVQEIANAFRKEVDNCQKEIQICRQETKLKDIEIVLQTKEIVQLKESNKALIEKVKNQKEISETVNCTNEMNGLRAQLVTLQELNRTKEVEAKELNAELQNVKQENVKLNGLVANATGKCNEEKTENEKELVQLKEVLGNLKQNNTNLRTQTIKDRAEIVQLKAATDSIQKELKCYKQNMPKGVVREVEVGAKVVRGKDWKWGAQDGGPNKVGEITRPSFTTGWVYVRWSNKKELNYRIGADGKFDLYYANVCQ